VDLGSKETSEGDNTTKFENQASDYSHRRHTDNDMVRPNLSNSKLEFTTQKLREEFPEEQDQLYDEIKEKFNLRRLDENNQFRPITEDAQNDSDKSAGAAEEVDAPKDKSDDKSLVKDDNKLAQSQSKKKRRKKSMIKKKNTQRKNSSSSSTGSVASEGNEIEANENVSGGSQDASPNTENDITKELPRDEEVSQPEPRRELDIHFFSDGELGSAMSPQQSRPSTPIQSDTEFEVSQRDKSENAMTSSASWKWGEPVVITSDDQDNANVSESNKRNSMLSGMLSFMKQKRKNVPDGLYLSDLDPETMDPEVAALYFPQMEKTKEPKREDDRESGNGTSLPQSPTTSMELIKSDSDCEDKQQADTSLNFVSLSICGGMEKGGPTDEEFDANIVQYSDICHNPALFSSPNLVVRLNNKYYSWMTACPVVMTLLAYQKPLPMDVCEKLLQHDQKPSDVENKLKEEEQQATQAESRRSWFSWRRSGGGSVQEPKKSSTQIGKSESVDGVATQTSPINSPYKTAIDGIKQNEMVNNSLSSEDSFNKAVKEYSDFAKSEMSLNTEKFRKTLRLSSQQIEQLNLKSGMNEVEFSVTTAYQGTSRCKCYVFKWKHNDKVVISDIDGTITKSDVLGHILPMVGKDWAQIGVAQLFSKIEENGYKMLYLSARAIGQSRATREYLRSIRQGDVQLPDGPLLLNPTSLISAFHREVIERKPEQFKIECLSDIKSLFTDKNPFYAGYGNRINVSLSLTSDGKAQVLTLNFLFRQDVWAYRAVGIPIMRIYTINPRGELKHELTQTFQST
jgi:phosphatidate phosphatase LPIN